jgi:hypothetical protein
MKMKQRRTRTRKKKTTRMKTKTSGNSRLWIARLLLAVCFTSPALAEKKNRQKEDGRESSPYALVAGTIYRPPGFALGGANVTITTEPPVKGSKPIKVVTDSRGEFAVRLPTSPSKYRVDIIKEGFKAEQRTVSVQGEERLDLSIVLDPVSREATEK